MTIAGDVNGEAMPSGESAAPHYFLRLFVAGSTPGSLRAIQNLKEICEHHLPGRYDLEIVDIYQQPELTLRMDLVAAPTLLKRLPEPIRRMVGDLWDIEKVLAGLSLQQGSDREGEATGRAIHDR